MLIGFFGRRIITGKPEQVAQQSPDLVSQVGRLANVEYPIRRRRHLFPWSLGYHVNAGFFGWPFPWAVRHAVKEVANFVWSCPAHSMHQSLTSSRRNGLRAPEYIGTEDMKRSRRR